MRIILFLLTNLAVMVVAGIVLSLLGVNGYMSSNGLNFSNLLIFCAVFGFAGSLVSLLLSKFMAKRGSGAVVIEKPSNHKEAWLLDTVQALSQQANIRMPEVAIFPSHDANAFATGWNKNDALVAVSSGMLERFPPDEIKAVLAHEIGHVANGDMVTLSLIQGVVNTFVMFFARIAAYAVDQFLRKDDNEGSVGWGYYIATFVFEIVFGILASMIVMWFSRFREFRADEAGARLAGKGAMIAALARLQQEHEESHMPDSMMAFGIRQGKRPTLGELFSSHPPIRDRIDALQKL
ncbi:protease HtpX [Marinomonas posidonica]|uniref:Protease HtpX n=1 Tax=Marinomonas posidonica (strain CECT 7376 / NCIMB 14433 / IVIA-Po-181) TaxID=491952 RepID=F6CZY5_MARPP|nr:protease HtpX [Marinomonas posidonica]AEF54725.1 protease htpX [Marinomonas posidonica IVIA-Po-181]